MLPHKEMEPSLIPIKKICLLWEYELIMSFQLKNSRSFVIKKIFAIGSWKFSIVGCKTHSQSLQRMIENFRKKMEDVDLIVSEKNINFTEAESKKMYWMRRTWDTKYLKFFWYLWYCYQIDFSQMNTKSEEKFDVL